MTRAVESYYDVVIGETVLVVFQDMDPAIKGQCFYLVKENAYAIFINTRHSTETQNEAFRHEQEHLRNGDFDKLDVQKIELEAHGIEPRKEINKEWYEELGKYLKRAKKRSKKKLEKYYAGMEERAREWAEVGMHEEIEIVDGEYGEPVVKRVLKIGIE